MLVRASIKWRPINMSKLTVANGVTERAHLELKSCIFPFCKRELSGIFLRNGCRGIYRDQQKGCYALEGI
jgi:hypothetical protein